MQETLEDLERQKNELYRQLAELGDFRRGVGEGRTGGGKLSPGAAMVGSMD